MTIETKFYTKTDNDICICKTCELNCVIKPGNRGRCNTYSNINGTLFYGDNKPSAMKVVTIEQENFFHFHPGERVLVLGQSTCNMNCCYCYNYTLSSNYLRTCNDIEDVFYETKLNVSPSDLCYLMEIKQCSILGFSLTEPSIWASGVLEWCKEAQRLNIPIIISSNGYFTLEVLKELSQFITAWNIDIKGDDSTYRDALKLSKGLSPIIRNIEYLISLNKHVEITVPVWDNNCDVEIWIDIFNTISSICKTIPIHFIKTVPVGEREEVCDELVTELSLAAVKANFVYVYNSINSRYQTTYCLKCKAILYKRSYNGICKNMGVCGDRCSSCGALSGVITDMK